MYIFVLSSIVAMLPNEGWTGLGDELVSVYLDVDFA